MKRQVLLDTNILIGAFDTDPENSAHIDAREKLRALLTNQDVEPVITSLILFEVLRGVQRVSATEMDARLKRLPCFPIRDDEARLAAQVFRYAKDNDRKLDKHSFDLLHCACAEVRGFEILAKDGDIPKIQQLIRDSNKNAQTY
ncbi:hypothetical protein AGMMS50256_37720 [Betaproteobacteria bacterium]|nr:hypothetical protein AGMMS50256_37720 [Betaproteobacteria bacterium]